MSLAPFRPAYSPGLPTHASPKHLTAMHGAPKKPWKLEYLADIRHGEPKMRVVLLFCIPANRQLSSLIGFGVPRRLSLSRRC
jgi:hypothetical protein